MKGPLLNHTRHFVFRRGKNDEHTLILNVYVDDLTLAGGTKNPSGNLERISAESQGRTIRVHLRNRNKDSWENAYDSKKNLQRSINDLSHA